MSDLHTTLGKTLLRDFYLPSALEVAPALLGHWLVRRTPQGISAGLIVETEAYLQDDPACHASRGETPRNRSMFGEPGSSYVYFIYGCHWCFNAVCQPKGQASAVLIRALEPAIGIESMRVRRSTEERQLCNGPAKLCEALAIDKQMDGVDLCDEQSELRIMRNLAHSAWLAARGPQVATTRIGITKGVDSLFRFYLAGSTHVSRKLSTVGSG